MRLIAHKHIVLLNIAAARQLLWHLQIILLLNLIFLVHSSDRPVLADNSTFVPAALTVIFTLLILAV